MEKIAIYGAGGFAREIAPLAAQQDIVFVSDLEREIGSIVQNKRVISFEELRSPEHALRTVAISVGNPRHRKILSEKCIHSGITFSSIVSKNSEIFDDTAIGEGHIICSNTMITSNVNIGRHFHLNIYSYVAHDCIIGDFVTFGPRVSCNGGVSIGSGVYVGAGAVLRDGKPDRPIHVGDGATIGMGAVVTRSIPAGETWVGNPARPIQR